MQTIIAKTMAIARRLSTGGMTISGADHFVIAASQTLICASAEELSFEEVKARLQEVRQKLAVAVALNNRLLKDFNSLCHSYNELLKANRKNEETLARLLGYDLPPPPPLLPCDGTTKQVTDGHL